MVGAASKESVKIRSGELPIEGLRDLLVVLLESEDAIGDSFLGVEIVGGEGFPLQHGEVDFDLVEPAGVNGQVDKNQVRPLIPESLNGSLPPMDGAVVDDPEDASGRAIGLSVHHRSYEGIEGLDGRAPHDVAEQTRVMDVPSGLIGACPHAAVLMFNAHRSARLGRSGRMTSFADLESSLLVGRQDKVVVSQWLIVPEALVEVEDTASLAGEVRIPAKDPAAVAPGTDRILGEPAPDGCARDLSHDALFEDMAPQLSAAEPRERHSNGGRKLARQGLDLSDDGWGENRRGDLRGLGPPVPQDVHRRSVCATRSPWVV